MTDRARPLRVLHLPVNVASQVSASVRGLREIGVEARGVVHSMGTGYVDDRALSVHHFTPWSLWRRLRFACDVLWSIAWADVVHWHYATVALPGALDLRLARLLRRPGVVEFWGSDIRIASLEEVDNAWYAARGPDYEYEAVETQEGSWGRQRLFAKHGVRTCLVPVAAKRFLAPGAFDRVVPTRTRLVLDDFAPPSPRAPGPPVIVHSPSMRAAKGTPAVLAAVEQVATRHALDFRLMHGRTREDNLEQVAACDLFLDQFVEGTTYGVAAVEAMALGKAVVCWIKPSALALQPEGLPVVVAGQDELVGVLEELVTHPDRLTELGERSLAWVRRHHDATYRARRLVELYDELLGRAGEPQTR